MEFAPVVALGTLVYTFVIFLKNLSAQQWRAVFTQVIAWLAGIGGIFVMAQTQFADGITVGDTTLARMDSWSKLVVGLLATSLLSTLHEFKKAIDRTDTAAVPDWFEPKAEATRRAHLVVPSDIATPDAIDAARRRVTGQVPTGHTTPTDG